MKRRWIAFGKGIGYIGLYVGMQTLVTIPLSVVLGFRLGLEASEDPSALMDMEARLMEMMADVTAPIILISGILTLILGAFLMKRKGGSMGAALTWNGFSPWLIVPLIFVGIAMNLAVQGVFSLLPESWLEVYDQSSSMVADSQNMSFWTVLSTVVMAPLVEEVIFRGAALSRLKRGFSWVTAVLIQAVVFGLCHGQWLWFTYTAVLGILLGWIWASLKSTPATILVHASFNGFSMLLMWEPLENWLYQLSPLSAIAWGGGLTILCMIAILCCGAQERLREPAAWEEKLPPQTMLDPAVVRGQNVPF